METAAMAVAQQAAGSLGGGGIALAILVGFAVVLVISAFQLASIKGR